MTLMIPEVQVVPLKTDPDGTVRIKGTRVILDLVIEGFNNGATPEDLVSRYDTLDLGDVYTVIAYYLHHKDEVDMFLKQRRDEAEVIIREIQAKQTGLRERLLARMANKEI